MKNLQTKDIVSLTVGTLGFLIACITFYLTQLRPPEITFEVGPEITIYFDNDGLGMYVPFVFINKTKRSGAISRVSVILYKTSSPNDGYYMRWADFAVYDSNTRVYDHLDHARAFSVPGEDTASKFVWFMWQGYSKPQFNLLEGRYELEFFIWEQDTSKPSTTLHYSFNVTSEIAILMNERKLNKDNSTYVLPLTGQKPANQLVNPSEQRSSFGFKK